MLVRGFRESSHGILGHNGKIAKSHRMPGGEVDPDIGGNSRQHQGPDAAGS
jgi:hypothetical protein